MPKKQFCKHGHNTFVTGRYRGRNCKACTKETDLGRRVYWLARLGITIEEYDAMLEAQGGVCAICKRVCTSGRRLSVDHDHKCCPGEKSCGRCVRGLLCRDCNTSIGKLGDNKETIEEAFMYFIRYEIDKEVEAELDLMVTA